MADEKFCWCGRSDTHIHGKVTDKERQLIMKSFAFGEEQEGKRILDDIEKFAGAVSYTPAGEIIRNTIRKSLLPYLLGIMKERAKEKVK